MSDGKTDLLTRLIEAVYQAFLHGFPRAFRRTTGGELLRELRAGCEDRRRRSGVVGVLGFAILELRDLLRNLLPAWHERRPTAPPHPRLAPRKGSPMSSVADFARDIRRSLRALRKAPAFATVAILTLALGIGANAAVFGIADAILLEPLPYPDASRLVYLIESYQQTQTRSVSWLNYLDWRKSNGMFADMAARSFWSFTLTGEGDATRLSAMLLTANVLPVLGVEPIHGRNFTPSEIDDEARAVILSHGLWRARFGSDPAVVGRRLMLDAEPFTVVGIMPAGLEFPLTGVDVYAPISMLSASDRANRGSHPGIAVIGRLRDGVTPEQARADLDAIAARLATAYPESNAAAGIVMTPLHERLVGDVAPIVGLLLAAVGVVLLIACANVANLLLARAATRQHAAAVEVALGAGRARVARQTITESVVLSLGGGAVGAALAIWLVDILRSLAAGSLPRVERIEVDATVLAFTFGVSLLTGVVFGALPALRVSTTDPARALRDAGSGRDTGGARVRSVLVASEVALAVVLLSAATLMVRSIDNLLTTDPGLDPRNVLAATVPVPQLEYPAIEDRATFYRQLLERLERLPGVVSVGGVDPLPLDVDNRQWSLSTEGFPHIDEDRLRTDQYNATPGYFRTVDIPLLAGRTFDGTETPESPVAVVDETLAARLWPDEPLEAVVGRQLRFTGSSSPWMSVVGVVGHVKHYGVNAGSRVQIYLPYTVNVWRLTVVARTAGEPLGLVPALRREVAELDPTVAVDEIRTMEGLFAATIAAERLTTRVLAAFGALALLLSLIGLYGVIAYSVSLRTREIGIRMALGAGRGHVVSAVVRQGMALAALGAASGALGALATGRLLGGLLFGVGPDDPPTLAGVVLASLAVALLATIWPARRATRVDPTIALRAD